MVEISAIHSFSRVKLTPLISHAMFEMRKNNKTTIANVYQHRTKKKIDEDVPYVHVD